MNDLIISARQTPGTVTFDNYEEAKASLQAFVRPFENLEYTLDDFDGAVQDRDTLKKKRDEITKVQKDLKEAYSKPYVVVEGMLNDLLQIVDGPYKKAKNFVLSAEKEKKMLDIMSYARQKAAALGEAGAKIVDSPAFFDKKWLNTNVGVKKFRDAVDAIIDQAAADLRSIQAVGGANEAAMTAHYLETLSMDSVKNFRASLHDTSEAADPIAVESESGVLGYKILKITATEAQMASLLDQLELMGVEVEEIEDGMPGTMTELTKPDFDSFVAFDIETTGTYGAANGDGEAKITEIGAVRVVDGEIVEKFDMLANPGRKILPNIARLTHITNEMVADAPPVDEVIRAFHAFVGDSVLVGHNIRNSDLHYINRAADRTGVRFDGAFLDTCSLAKTFKARMDWEKVSLPYLADYYCFEHKEAHRAWSDAEVNAQVYFELKKLSEKQ